MILDGTGELLELELGDAVSTDFSACFLNRSAGAITEGNSNGNTSSSGTQTLVASPPASTSRVVTRASVFNRSTTASQRVIVKFDDGTNERHLARAVLGPQEQFRYNGNDWLVYGADGLPRTVAAQLDPIDGYSLELYKQGSTAEATNHWHSYFLVAGIPGAWAPGTPGVNGRATDGTAAADAGCLPVPTAASGSTYLVSWSVHSTVVHPTYLLDVLWVNSGLAVTTTTAQALTSVAWPARDLTGTSDGKAVLIGILVTTATTNGAGIANTTMSYTNQAGTAGRTATMTQFPATAVAGTIVWFELQAGDTGVRSVQSITLGTSYGGGAISLIAARRLAMAPVVTAAVPAVAPIRPSELGGAGIKLWPGVCLLAAYKATTTTATVIDGHAVFEVR